MGSEASGTPMTSPGISCTSSAAASPAARPPGSSPSAGTTSCCTRCGRVRGTPAHKTDRSPSSCARTPSRAPRPTNAHGLLKAEMRLLGSHDPRVRRRGARPRRQRAHRRPRASSPRPCTSACTRTRASRRARGGDRAAGAGHRRHRPAHLRRARRGDPRSGSASTSLAFYDAIAPIVAVRLDRHERRLPRVALGQGDDGAARARRARTSTARSRARSTRRSSTRSPPPTSTRAHEFDPVPYFEGCMPVEEMAKRGRETLRFGPMKPVGLRDPRTGSGRTPSRSCAWRTRAAACGTSSASRRACASASSSACSA